MKYNPTYIPRDGLVAEYLLDGNAKDTAGSNDGTATNVSYPTSDRWYVNDVWEFNGSSSYVNIPSVTLNNNYTINLWFNTDNFPTTWNPAGWLLSSRTSGQNDRGSIWCLNNQILVLGGSSGQLGWNLVTNKRYMVTYTKSWNTYTCYVDKQQISTFTDSNTINALNLPRLGSLGQYVFPQEFYDGQLWIVRIYNRALDAEEIDALYQEWLRKLGPTNLIGNNIGGAVGKFQKYSTYNLENGKILEISKPNVSWTYYDQTGSGNNGSETDVTDSALNKNNVMSFNGTSSRVTFPDLWLFSWASDFSICFWQASNSVTTDQDIINLWWEYDIKVKYNFAGNWKIKFQNFDWATELNVFSNTAVNDNISRFITVIYKNTWDAEIRINWVLDNTGTLNTNPQVLTGTNTIWANENQTWNFYDWQIIQPMIWNRALSDEEVQQLFYSNYITT